MADNSGCTAPLYFFRHAEKAASQERDPPLTEAGQRRAEALARRMAREPLSGIYATRYQRTQHTAAPTARAQALPIRPYEAGQSAALVARLLVEGCSGPVLVIGHSNTLPEMLRAAGIEESAGEFDESLYGLLYIVRRAEGSATLSIEKVGD
jgi:broad specificity phosphatase PhoE